MANLLLDSDHDILVGRGTTRVSGLSDEYIAQLVKCRLLFITGTWELDLSLGIPWFEELLEYGTEDSLFLGIIRTTVEQTRGVARLDAIAARRVDRKIFIRFTATTVNGKSISLEV